MTAADRLNGRVGGLTSWRNMDAAARARRTSKGRSALLKKYETEADPEGKLPPHERAREADRLMKLHMAKMTAASAKSRRKKAATKKTSIQGGDSGG